MRKFIFILMILFAIGNASGLGVTPGRTTVDFTPGYSGDYTVTIVNSEQRDVSLVVTVQGELQDYLQIPTNVIQMKASETSKDITFKVTLPDSLEPGTHTGEILIVQLPDSYSKVGETAVGAVVAVATQFYVNVPYPGKYLEAKINVVPRENGDVDFIIPTASLGVFDLTSVKGIVDVYSGDDKIATLGTEETRLMSKQRGELHTTWNAQDFSSGSYLAKATVQWDEGTTNVEKEFSLGTKKLTLESIEVNDFSLGDIAKFEILVGNNWESTIEDVFAEIVVFNANGNVLANIRSPTADIPESSKEQLLAFWDTEGIRVGSYEATLFLKHGDEKEQQDLVFEVAEDKIKIIGAGYIISSGIVGGGLSTTTLYILITVIVVLVIANISWFMYLRKRFKK